MGPGSVGLAVEGMGVSLWMYGEWGGVSLWGWMYRCWASPYGCIGAGCPYRAGPYGAGGVEGGHLPAGVWRGAWGVSLWMYGGGLPMGQGSTGPEP